MVAGWDFQLGDNPLPPINGMVFSGYSPGVVDIRWDDPALLAGNSVFTILGVNVYRSDVSDRGPYTRINEVPLGGSFYRDRTEIVRVERELVRWDQDWQYQGDAPNDRRFVFCTQNPIAKPGNPGPYGSEAFANAASDVTLYIDDVQVPVAHVFGRDGSVTLINHPVYDPVMERELPATLPGPDSVVEVSYYTTRNFVRSGLDLLTFYRIVTVALDPDAPSGTRETPLQFCQPLTRFNTEQMDYIWREAVRRNHWILQQGGERVKLFIKRTSGIPCDCSLDAMTLEYSGQPLNRCLACYGTGYLGGYEGPYDIIITPDESERRISQRDSGRKKEHMLDVWMTLTPMVTMRDFIVKQTGERYSIGAVRRIASRGVILQQHYPMGYLDEQDIRYRVPIDGSSGLINAPATRYAQVPTPLLGKDGALPDAAPYPVGADAISPMVTNKTNIPEERRGRGRTGVWENIES